MHPTRHLILNTQTWKDKYEICNHVRSSAGGPGLIINQRARVYNSETGCIQWWVCMYLLLKPPQQEMCLRCLAFLQTHNMNHIRCWLSKKETAGRLTLTKLLQEYASSLFSRSLNAVLPWLQPAGYGALLFWLTLGNCNVCKWPLPQLQWNTWKMVKSVCTVYG